MHFHVVTVTFIIPHKVTYIVHFITTGSSPTVRKLDGSEHENGEEPLC